MQGIILKGVGGFYTVRCDGQDYTCRARGRFRRDGVTPLPGDAVEFTPGAGEQLGFVDGILPRSNALKRPAVANVTTLVLVTSAADPDPDLLLLDKLLVLARPLGVKTVLAVNKCDLGDAKAVSAVLEDFAGAVSAALPVSAVSGAGLDALQSRLAGRCSCLAGQSGVGKSSLLNRLLPGRNLETGAVSCRTARGKHTTRHAELLPLPGGGFVADTPGFSLAEVDPIDPAELPGRYPEFAAYDGQCRFAGCLHDREPGCAVKEAAQCSAVPTGRYARYLELLKETRETWRNRYD